MVVLPDRMTFSLFSVQRVQGNSTDPAQAGCMHETGGAFCLLKVCPFLLGPNTETTEHRATYDRYELVLEGSLGERWTRMEFERCSSDRLDVLQRRPPWEIDGCRS